MLVPIFRFNAGITKWSEGNRAVVNRGYLI